MNKEESKITVSFESESEDEIVKWCKNFHNTISGINYKQISSQLKRKWWFFGSWQAKLIYHKQLSQN